MIQFVPRKIQSNFWTVLSPIISITITIFIGSLIFKILNYPVLESLYQVFISPFSRPDRIADIFVKACPLIIIGRSLKANPKVLITSQPTWGVDIGAANEIKHKLLQLAKNGKAIILISQDLDEIFEISNKISVINNGSLSVPKETSKISSSEIGVLMGIN